MNAQLVVDAHPTHRRDGITNTGSNMGQTIPMHDDIWQRYATTPQHWLPDGGFTKLAAIDELTACGKSPVVPPPRSRNPDIDVLAPKSADSAAHAQPGDRSGGLTPGIFRRATGRERTSWMYATPTRKA